MSIRTLSLLVVAVTGVAQGNVGAQEPGGSPPPFPEIITVQGEGEVSVAPDIAILSVAVENEASTADEAQRANAQASRQVERVVVDQFKLPAKDVGSGGYDLQAVYDWSKDGKQNLRGYRAANHFQITLRKLDQVGKLIDALAKAGINRIDQLRFDVEKAQTHELEALRRAMDNAKQRAAVIATAAGRPIRKVVQVEESRQWMRPPPFEFRQKMVAMSADAAEQSYVPASNVRVQATVTVRYAF